MSRASTPACPVCGRSDLLPAAFGPACDTVALAHVLHHMTAIARRYGRHVGLLHVHADGLTGLRVATRDEKVLAAAELRVIRRLRRCVRDSDVVARLAPDRFALALGDLWEPEMIARVAERVMRAFARPLRMNGVERLCPVRIGIAVWPGDTAEIHDLAALAAETGERLRGGDSAVAYHDARLASFALRQQEVEQGFREMSSKELFELHYQPIFSLATGQPVGAEALVRWNQPNGTQVAAGQFIELAERTGRIASLDRWAIGVAARQAAEWHRRGWPGWISVNLSSRTLDTEGLTHHFASAIESAEADPRQLLVEVTESAAMRDRGASMSALEALRGLGVHLAVDDFGVGHASFSYLRDFNPDVVKLDKSFLIDVESDQRTHRMMEGLILMAHHLGKPVVAEGCERDVQMRWLEDAGCDLVQGYLTGRPMDADSFRNRIVDAPLSLGRPLDA